MTTIFSDGKPEDSDAAFWEGYEDADLIALISSAVKAFNVSKEEHRTKEVRFKKRGNIKGLGKHLAKKYGPADKGFFTRCMAAEELAGYDEETRKAICARAHKEQIGHWPGDKPPFNEEKKEGCTKCGRTVRIRRHK